MQETLDELVTRLRAAVSMVTPGPWVVATDNYGVRRIWSHPLDGNSLDVLDEDQCRRGRMNQEFVALANPLNVQRLLNELRRLQADLLGWRVQAERAEAKLAQLRSFGVNVDNYGH